MKPANILLVEDNIADIKIAQEAFKKFKMHNKLCVVYDGEEALKFLKENEADIVLLDLSLPKKNSIEVLKEIKEDDNLKHIPVIILTTSETHEDVLEAYKDYASCYITKPINVIELVKAIEHFGSFWLSIVKI